MAGGGRTHGWIRQTRSRRVFACALRWRPLCRELESAVQRFRSGRATHHPSLAMLPIPPRRRILHHIKLNHDSQRPEALAKNFMLLSEVNANIESVQRLYLDIERDYISFMAENVSKSAGKQTS